MDDPEELGKEGREDFITECFQEAKTKFHLEGSLFSKMTFFPA